MIQREVMAELRNLLSWVGEGRYGTADDFDFEAFDEDMDQVNDNIFQLDEERQ